MQQSVFNTTSQNISMAQVSQKKYYDIRHSRNFKFAKNDIVIKFLPRNSQRRGGKLEDKFSGPYVIDEITDLGIARLRTLKGKVLKKGVPIKQLQKYNKKDDERNYSNTSSDTDNEDQPRKRMRISSDSESSKTDVDVISGSVSVHYVDSNTKSEIHEKQDQATPSVKQSVTPAKQDQATPSVKQSVTPVKQDQATLSVKQSVTPAKQDQATPSVKQSVTQNMINDKESFTPTTMSTQYNRKKIIITPVNSPITQIKGGIKKIKPHKRKFFFQHFTNEKEKWGTEIELCDTLPDLDNENKNKVCLGLSDMLDTLPDIPVHNNEQTNGCEAPKTVSQPEVQEIEFYEGDPVLFFPITNSTRRNIGPFFGLFDMNRMMRQMPDYKLGGTGQGLKPPKKTFVIKGDGNCYFRAVSFILTGVEKHHFVV